MRVINTIDFGKLIHATRKKTKLTQADLATASGIGECFVQELEKGKVSCQLEKALLVAQMLGIKFEAKLPPQQISNHHEKNQLSVRLNGEPVGILEQTPTGKMTFTYDASATQAVSIGTYSA
jgi:y4mF family transcriptional regulator